MVTEEITETQTDSTVSTPASTDAPALVSTETAAPASEGTETPAPEEKVEAPARPLTLAELDRKAEKDGLSAEETKQWRSLQQSHADQWREDEKNRAKLAAAQEQRAKQLLGLKDQLATDLADVREARLNHLRNGTYTDDVAVLLDKEESRLLDDYHGKAEPVHLTPFDQALSTTLLMQWGDSARTRSWIDSLDMPSKLQAIYQKAFEDGRLHGPGEGYVVKAQKDYDTEIAKAKTEAVDDFKASRPDLFPGGVSTGDVRRNGGSNFYSQMTKEERDALSPDQRDQAVALEAAAKS